MAAVSAVPNARPVAAVQLPLFESTRPSRYQLTLGGNIDLSLADADEGRLAAGLTLRRKFVITIAPADDLDEAVTFDATVTKRTHKTVRHAEHGDAVVSAAVLTVAGLNTGE